MIFDTEEWLTLKDAGQRWGRHPDNLRQRIARGTLQARKVGRDWMVAAAEMRRAFGDPP